MGVWENAIDISNLENRFAKASLGGSFALGGADYYFDLKCEADYLRAFNSCPPLKAIISKRAKAFNAGTIQVINRNNGNFAKGTEAKEIEQLFKRPNALQSGAQFKAQQNYYIDIFGYCPVYKVKSIGFEIPTSQWNIPPWLFDLKYSGHFLGQVQLKEIYSNFFWYWNGEKVELNYDNIYLVFDDGVGTDNDCNLTIPDSRLIGNEYPVSNIIAAYKSRNTLITKRGALGILSNDGRDKAGIVSNDVSKIDQLQKDFKKYGIVGQPFQTIITDASLRWQQMGFATRDLMLFEEIQDDIDRLCDAYGFPAELIARSKDTTFDNKKQARKDLFENTIVPEADSRIAQNSNGLLGAESRFEIVVDYSGISILQEDAKDKADARNAMNDALQKEFDADLITKNDWLEAIGRDRRTDRPDFDLYKSEIAAPAAPEAIDTATEETTI
jgi:hypothetical protein